jgi:twitching motility protein PilI
MARRIDLVAYRESIAARLAAAESGGGTPALLGFEAGDGRWLIELPAAGEVLPVPPLTPVPLTYAWFAGLASVHGELEAVVDLSVFCGGPPTPREGAARILRIGMKSGGNAALLVGRVHGLKRTDTLFADPDAAPVGDDWRGQVCIDNQGERWTHLDPLRLLADPRFLDATMSDQDAIADIGIP